MWTQTVRIVEDASPASWLAGRLTGPIGTVVGTVPDGYAAYARVLHPVDRHDGTQPVTWAQVSEVTGRQVHPTVQWHALIGSDDPYDRGSDVWPDGRPEWGNLSVAPLQALCDVLAAHTTTPQHCYFALWEGWGQLSGGRAWVRLASDGSGGSEPPPLLTPQERSAPRVHLPGRDYFLFRGPLSAVLDLARYDGPEFGWAQSPNLFWPADRAWCVATEIDFDSTLVGGAPEAVEAVLASPALEAWRIGSRDSLRSDADAVNH
ncbi:hypothetical protein [Georgenia sp. SYP-B2076]|uniref:hypothetical protein n=1 Tax=Georgenia sp. SYP-B2076 TaxID=2495881 RepID=UPI000F8EDD9A|nr:hypothetical protein [Georgenia sp. SYP-B2076]